MASKFGRIARAAVAGAAQALLLALLLAGPAAAQQATVRWWTWDPPGAGFVGISATQDVFIREFNKVHPQIKIEPTFYVFGEYLNNLRLAMLASPAPDVIGLQAGAMLKAYDDLLVDLAPYAAKTWGAAWSDRFFKVGLDGLMENGKTSALPQQLIGAGFLWANKAVLDKHGLKPPRTLDDLTAMARALNPKGEVALLVGAADAWNNNDIFMAIANDIAPGRIYAAEAGKASFEDPAFVQAMRFWKRLFDDKIVQDGALGNRIYGGAGDMYTAWVTGRGALFPIGTWGSRLITKGGVETHMKGNKMEGDHTAFGNRVPVAFPDVNGDGRPPPLAVGANSWGIHRSSTAKDAAWTFVAWMLDAEGGQRVYGNAKDLRLPAVKNVALDYSDAVSKEQEDAVKEQLARLDSAAGYRDLKHPEVAKALHDAMQAVAAGRKTPEAALKDVQTVSAGIAR